VDVFTWGAIALVVGPVLAGLSIPIFRWLFEDLTRLLVLLVALGAGYLYWQG
jgi:hypothetical protein